MEGFAVLHTVFRYATYAALAFGAWAALGLAVVLASNFIAWLTGWRLNIYPRATVCASCEGEDCRHKAGCPLEDTCPVCEATGKNCHYARCPLASEGFRSEEHTSELQSLRHLVC